MPTSMDQLLINLQGIVAPAAGLLLTVSYILGVLMILRGIIMMKTLAVPLTQMSRPGEMMGPIVYIVIGSILLWIAPSANVLSTTFFQSTDYSLHSLAGVPTEAAMVLLSSADAGIQSEWSDLISTLVLYIQLIGFIAFIRGWIIIAAAGQASAQPGQMSKGIIHVIGGILAINFIPLVQVVQNSLTVSS
jgi:intracellular multiplication protein IcmC